MLSAGSAPPSRRACLPTTWCWLLGGMQFDELLKKQSVTLEESSRICRGAPASGDSPIDGYWSCLCDKPLLRNTGRHVAARLGPCIGRPCARSPHPPPRPHIAPASRRVRRAPSLARFATPRRHTLNLSLSLTGHTRTLTLP